MSKRDNSGTFSRNKDKQDGDNKPHIKGQCTINGVDYWLDGWLKDGTNGSFYSVAFKEKEQRRDSRPAQKASQKMQSPSSRHDDELRKLLEAKDALVRAKLG